MSQPPVRVRPLLREDVEPVLDLLMRQEFTAYHGREVLRGMFVDTWTPDAPDNGVVLAAGNRLVGCLMGINSERHVGGQPLRICNASTWFVEPEYRAHSMQLLTALMERPGVVLTSLTASPRAGLVMETLGFDVLGPDLLWFGPRLSWLGMGPRGASILDDPRAIAPLLSEEQRRILEDHRPYRCGHYLVRRGDATCYIVTKRRPVEPAGRLLRLADMLPRWLPARLRLQYYPVSDLLFLSDPAVAVACWGLVCRRIMLRERTFGLTVCESFLGAAAPAAPPAGRGRRPLYVYPRGTDPTVVDGLYSELVLLPI